MKNSLGAQSETARGFPIVEFEDANGHPCSLQLSSVYGLDHIWLGPTEADPKVLASKAAQFGVRTEETTGWVPYPIADDVLLTTRMHLNRDQITALVRHLQTFLETGEFEIRKEDAAG